MADFIFIVPSRQVRSMYYNLLDRADLFFYKEKPVENQSREKTADM